jgi:hypothetical protein
VGSNFSHTTIINCILSFKEVASLSDRARKEGRVGVTDIVDMGFFFLFVGDGRATELINYEALLPPKREGCNIKGFSFYHGGNYNNIL